MVYVPLPCSLPSTAHFYFFIYLQLHQQKTTKRNPFESRRLAKKRPQGVSVSLLSPGSTVLTQVAGLCSLYPRRWAGKIELATPRRQNHNDLRLLLRRNDPIDCGHVVTLQEANTKWCKHLFIQIKKDKKKKILQQSQHLSWITHTHAQRKKMKQKKPRRQTGLHFSCAYKHFFLVFN